MVITITTSTITTITSMVALGVIAGTSLAVVLSWIGLLGTRVLASATRSGSAQRISTFITVGILPLTIVFLVILSMKVAGVLS